MAWNEDIQRIRESALEIVSLLSGRVKPTELSEAEGRAQHIADKIYEMRQRERTTTE